jgi:glycosyltransferase involved in cell wall biosynthesis
VRLLYFTQDYTPHDHRFLTSLAGNGREIFSLRLEKRVTQLEDRPLPPQVEQVLWGGGQEPFRWRALLSLVMDLRRVIRRIKPDLIHAGPVPTVAFLAALSGFRPLVSMSWGSDLLRDVEKSSWLKWTARYALRRTRVLVGDCLAVKEKAVSLGYPDERIVLFPWGVDLQHFQPSAEDEFRQRLGWQKEFVILSLRTWEPLYGVDLLVRAFCRAARQEPRLRLALLGEGSQAGVIRQMILRNQLDDRVHFGGQVRNDQLPRYYHAADLYVSASHSDGSSVSLMEALACGKPALVSDIPGNREWIIPGKQGWLFPDGDEAALAEGMLQAVRQRSKLKEMGAAARRLAEERADWKINFNKLLEAYEMAVADVGKGPG